MVSDALENAFLYFHDFDPVKWQNPFAYFTQVTYYACLRRIADSPRPFVAAIDGDSAPALKVGDVVLAVDPRYFRPAEVETLLGDPSKAKARLGWEPEITAQQMCAEMVAEDLKAAQRHAFLQRHGHGQPVAREERT